MVFKSINLNIFCLKRPCNLTVISNDGTIVKKGKINSFFSTINICTKGQSIKIIASYNGLSVCKTICLSDMKCQNYCVDFSFSARLWQGQICLITLKDKNYGFPILNATLKFIQR